MSTLHLRSVDPKSIDDIQLLYKILGERKPWQSISHRKMPTFGEHRDFVKSKPYAAWYFIIKEVPPPPNEPWDCNEIVGSTYLTHNNELGIFIFKEYHGQGFGSRAINLIMSMHEPPFYANINPINHVSREFFTKLGFKFIQTTYVFGEDDAK